MKNMLIPWMKLFTAPAQQVQQQRINLNKTNPFWELQEELTNLTTLFLENCTTFRGNLQEQVFCHALISGVIHCK